MVQNLVVAMLVAGCFVYALWTLAPKAPRSRLAAALLKLPLPLLLQRPLTQALRQQGACGACGGCERAANKPEKPGGLAQAERALCQPVNFVRGNFSNRLPR